MMAIKTKYDFCQQKKDENPTMPGQSSHDEVGLLG